MGMVFPSEEKVFVIVRVQLLFTSLMLLPYFELCRFGLFEEDVRSGIRFLFDVLDVVVPEVDHPIQIVFCGVTVLDEMPKLSHVATHEFFWLFEFLRLLPFLHTAI